MGLIRRWVRLGAGAIVWHASSVVARTFTTDQLTDIADRYAEDGVFLDFIERELARRRRAK